MDGISLMHKMPVSFLSPFSARASIQVKHRPLKYSLLLCKTSFTYRQSVTRPTVCSLRPILKEIAFMSPHSSSSAFEFARKVFWACEACDLPWGLGCLSHHPHTHPFRRKGCFLLPETQKSWETQRL